MMSNNAIFKTIRSESELRIFLESISLTDNIQSLLTLFTTLGSYILCKPENFGLIIKFKPLYDKILLVLNQGPPTKTKLTLNLIYSLLLAELGNNQSKTETLRMHAQNMIRISGCLLALSHLFTNSMLQHETWIALCQSLSEACHKSVLNQNYCSHLVPLCIQRCRRSNTDALLVLHSLLVDHDKNIKVFYEADGMTIFSRDNLLYPSYLRTLNTIIEGTKPSHRNYIRNSPNIFQCLRRWVLTDESGSAVTQWALIALYSRGKLLGADAKLCDEPVGCSNDSGELIHDFGQFVVHGESTLKESEERENFIEDPNSETRNLFRNVMKEVYDWKVHSQMKRVPHIPVRPIGNIINNNDVAHLFKFNATKKPSSFLNLRNHTFSKQGSAIFKHGMKKAAGELSFSFLLKNDRDTCRELRSGIAGNYTTSKPAPLDFRERSRLTKTSYRRSKLSGINSQSGTEVNTRRIKDTPSRDTFGRTTCTINECEHNTEVIDFRPQHVSTPKRRYNRKVNTPSASKTVIKDVSFKRPSPKFVKNSYMTSKFMDIINGSCTTIAKGISKIKNVLVAKTKRAENDIVNTPNLTNGDCSFSFTNYMRKRDAFECRASSRSGEESNCSEVPSSCQTCNDTIVLKRKLLDNPSLKECVKKLKLGINLYGCDFKKISRILWPREPVMTPEVLYTLYRKLIAK